jgi:hypothetical protein
MFTSTSQHRSTFDPRAHGEDPEPALHRHEPQSARTGTDEPVFVSKPAATRPLAQPIATRQAEINARLVRRLARRVRNSAGPDRARIGVFDLSLHGGQRTQTTIWLRGVPLNEVSVKDKAVVGSGNGRTSRNDCPWWRSVPRICCAAAILFRRPAVRNLAISRAGVGAVGSSAQHVRVRQRVKGDSAKRRVQAAQTLHLFSGQPQARHFHELSPDALDHGFGFTSRGSCHGFVRSTGAPTLRVALVAPHRTDSVGVLVSGALGDYHEFPETFPLARAHVCYDAPVTDGRRAPPVPRRCFDKGTSQSRTVLTRRDELCACGAGIETYRTMNSCSNPIAP